MFALIMANIEYKGDFFLNPDQSANIKYTKIINPSATKGWGAIMTPDEMRRIWMFGNSKLTTMGGDQYTDEMLSGIIEQYVLAIQEELQHDVYPIQWRHRPLSASDHREIEDYARWSELIDFRVNNNVNQNYYVRIRKPILKLQKWELRDPFSKQLVIDLKDTAEIQYTTGELRSTLIGMYPGYAGTLSSNLPVTGRVFGMRPGLSVPNAYCIDHISGYDHANRVPPDLKRFINKVITIHILSRYGDGIVGGLASFSVSAGVISESVSTTMSASIDGADKVTIRKVDRMTSWPIDVFQIPIGDFLKMFEGDRGERNSTKGYYYETLSVNPSNIYQTGWKEVLDVVEHNASGKRCYRIKSGNLYDSIGITEDHSLFRIEDSRLYEVTGAQIKNGDHIAILNNSGKAYNQEVTEKSEYRPRNDKVYDLSVRDWQNFVVNGSYIAHNTSAYFGATIMQFQNELKEELPKIEAKYTGLQIAIL